MGMRLNTLVSSVSLVSSLMVAPAAAAADAWVVDLRAAGPDSTNVVTDGEVRLGPEAGRANSAGADLRTGFAVYGTRLAAPANGFSAEVASTVPDGAELAIDVRGLAPPGASGGGTGAQWTEWTEALPGAPAALPVAVTEVQVRVMVAAPAGVASPRLTALSVRPVTVPGRPAVRAVDGAGPAYSVFATREGLAGGVTANGHLVTARDHFVALPSRRGLSGRNGGEYSVRVCADGRCAWAPVWDVGPWNTRDDYWAAPGSRQEWNDLPQGMPAAQAAYQDGYNDGKDEFGRTVANPAGIDLADGTFWDGLQLKSNAWVTVTYLWAGTYPAGDVRTPGDTLEVRSAPAVQAPVVGIAGNLAQVRVECVVVGDAVTGSQGTSSAWYRLAAGMFAPAAAVSGGGAAPAC